MAFLSGLKKAIYEHGNHEIGKKSGDEKRSML